MTAVSKEAPSPSRVLALFAFGAIAIPIFDGFHTHSRTTAYAHPVIGLAAWWVPLLFGTSVGAGGTIFALLYPKLGGNREPPPWSALAPAFGAFAGLYFASGFWSAPHGVKLGLFLAASIALWGWLDRTWQGALMTVVTAILGTSVEMTLTSIGAFWYLAPDVVGVPIWLPGLYLCSGPVLGHGARRWLAAG